MTADTRDPWPEFLQQRLDAWARDDLTRELRVLETRGTVALVDGREVVHFAGNDYLGLSAHPAVIEAARAAAARFGAGATASRMICGTRPIHVELETALASFKGSEGALVFSSGYQAAVSAQVALLGRDPSDMAASAPAVLLDRLCHASLIDGARLSGARLRTFKHNDADDLRRLLKKEAGASRMLVVAESLYSMDGDLAPLAELHRAARDAGAWLLIDEAHATGVLGPDGRGALADVFPEGLPPEVLTLGTLSKALGGQGGFIAGPNIALRNIMHAGRGYLFSTGIAPAAAGAALEALKHIDDGGRRVRLLQEADRLRGRLKDQGWRILGGAGPILPILIGSEAEALRLAAGLWQAGYWVPAIRYPTVKLGQARLRLSLSAAHDAAQIDGLVGALGKLRSGR